MKVEANKIKTKRIDSLLHDGNKEQQESQYLSKYNNRTSTSLSYHIVYNREGELFDSPEVKERDLELQTASGTTITFRDDNKKIINLSNNQMRVIYGLSKLLSYKIEQTDVEVNIRAQTHTDTQRIPKTINIEELTKVIYNGSCRIREKEEVIKELYSLDKIRQHFTLKTNPLHFTEFTAPIIKILETYKATNEKGEELHLMNLYFGWVFYHNLENKFTLLPPQLFEYWEQGELFPVLFASLQIAQRTCIAKADKEENRLKQENATPEEINKARENMLTYTLDFTSIQERIVTDYAKNPKRFLQHLEKCVEAFKNMELIKGAKIAKGKKGQNKVVFYILDKKELLELTE